jgi:carbamoyltransferase
MQKEIYILWISCFFHDSSVALLKNGEIIFAIEEEKLTGIKHDNTFPEKAIKACLSYCKLEIGEIYYVGFYEKPFFKFENFIKNYIYNYPFWYYWFIRGVKEWLKYKLFFKRILKKKIWYNWEIIYIYHHLSHASGAFFSSWYEKSAILTVDWVWEESTTTRWVWNKNDIEIKESINFPNSIGLLYSTFTAYLWFEVNEWEYKMMWLAPYWKPIYYDTIEKQLLNINKDWSFELNMKYFSFQYWKTMFNSRFEKLFWNKQRIKVDNITQFHKDIASSIQKVAELLLLNIVEYIYEKTKLDNLCISWWVGLNCVANYNLLKNSKFKNIYIQPSPWDSWSTIWVCYYIYSSILWKESKKFENIYLWESFSDNTILTTFEKYEKQIKYEKLSFDILIQKVAKLIYKDKIIWWFQDRTEFWPRALGNRSILWNPLNKDNWKKINLKIKFRESFRPFAPSIIEEDLSKYYDLNGEFPYMLFIAKAKNIDLFPAVTHIDWTSRVQTVNIEQNKKYYLLLKEFEKIAGFPILINTSFNLWWNPIVNNPKDAINTFLNCEMDYLVLWNYFITKI